MTLKTYRNTIRETLAQEMRRDPSVVVIGEDVAGGMGGTGDTDSWGGAQRIIEGLVSQFGRDRVIDVPISETAFLGAAAAAASAGLRPVVEIMFVDFFGVCFDQLLNNIAKFRYVSGGQCTTPITIRSTYGAGVRSAGQHAQTLHPIFTHIPGIKVVVPSCPYDLKGLLAQAIRDDDPVVFFEHRMLLADEQDVPDEEYVLPFGQAHIIRTGRDATIFAVGRMVKFAIAAAENLEKAGISCTVIDPRTLSPLDIGAVVASVAETGYLIAVDESNPRCSIAIDVVGQTAVQLGKHLKGSRIVTPPHTPVPYAGVIEDLYVPNAATIESAVRNVLGRAL